MLGGAPLPQYEEPVPLSGSELGGTYAGLGEHREYEVSMQHGGAGGTYAGLGDHREYEVSMQHGGAGGTYAGLGDHREYADPMQHGGAGGTYAGLGDHREYADPSTPTQRTFELSSDDQYVGLQHDHRLYAPGKTEYQA